MGNNMQVIHVPMGFANDRHKTPQFLETNATKFVQYGTDDKYYNAYPQYLYELFNRSAKHSAIINGKCDYIYGKGFKDTVIRPNPDEDINQLMRKCVKDFEIFNGFALEVIWSKAYGKIAEIRHLPFMRVRTNATSNQFFYSKKWDIKRRPQDSEITIIDEFNAKNPVGRQLLYVKGYDAANSVYSLPEYIGAVPYIETDIEIANFHLNNIRNQFWGGQMIVFYTGVPSEDEKATVERDIKKKFSGSDNAGKFVTVFADSKERGIEVIPITSNDLDKQFDILNKTVQQEIFTAHRVTSPMLFGIKTEGQLGGRSELMDADELFRNVYVNSRQQIIEETFSKLFSINTPVELKIENTSIIKQQFTENILMQIMSKDELRKQIGLEPLVQISADGSGPQQPQPINQDAAMVNDHLKGLTGRQTQNLMRIVRNYSSGKISKDQAMILITGGFGLSESDALSFLGIEASFKIQLSAADKKNIDEEENKLLALFGKYGRSKEDFEIVEVKSEWVEENFADATLTNTDKKVLQIINEDKKATVENIAKSLNKTVAEVKTIIETLTENGAITSSTTGTTTTDTGKSILENAPVSVTNISVKYAYDVAPGLGAPIIAGTRDFCKELVGMNKLFDRADIQKIGLEWGYDVWQFRGGFYRNPKTDETTPYCRHIWTQVLVREKAKIN